MYNILHLNSICLLNNFCNRLKLSTSAVFCIYRKVITHYRHSGILSHINFHYTYCQETYLTYGNQALFKYSSQVGYLLFSSTETRSMNAKLFADTSTIVHQLRASLNWGSMGKESYTCCKCWQKGAGILSFIVKAYSCCKLTFASIYYRRQASRK